MGQPCETPNKDLVMIGRIVTSFSLLFLAACAAPTTSRVAPVRFPAVAPQLEATATTTESGVSPSEFGYRDGLAFEGRVAEELPIVTGDRPAQPLGAAPWDAPVAAEPMYKVLGGDSYTIAKIGAFMPAGDLDDGGVDDGLAVDLIFGHKLMPILSIEGSIGYITADGGVGNFEIMAIPLFVNGRLSLPILIFEAYGGLGLGGIYADYEATGVSDSDFVLAGQAFLGVEVGLGNLAIGAEYRYIKSEDTSGFVGGSADDFAIEGGIASIFVSLPF